MGFLLVGCCNLRRELATHCGREFTRANLRELTVHHRDHNHDKNPPDGSNWELLCGIEGVRIQLPFLPRGTSLIAATRNTSAVSLRVEHPQWTRRIPKGSRATEIVTRS